MTGQGQKTMAIHVNVEVTETALATVMVEAKKRLTHQARKELGIDTADYIGRMISKFLAEKDFESYVLDPDNYF
jgi:hypothetical protein